MKKALITGISGQDGSYLAEFLLSKGYEVHGLVRRASSCNTRRIKHLEDNPAFRSSFLLHYGDMAQSESLLSIISAVRPDEVYNLAAQSHVRISFDIPEYTSEVTGTGALRVLDILRKINPECRFYQASSSELFGSSPPPQNEKTPFLPQSPYAAAKLYAYWITKQYRDAYGLYACNGILFNHESPRRGEIFVTRKITRAIANILAGRQDFLYLGNLDAKRDWGYAPDYVVAMWTMLQQDQPEDYVIGTGLTHSVRDFLTEAFSYVNLDWHDYVKIDPQFFRPNEVDVLLADTTKAKTQLHWQPRISFADLVKVMVDADLELSGLESPGQGKLIVAKHHGDWHKWEHQVPSMDAVH